VPGGSWQVSEAKFCFEWKVATMAKQRVSRSDLRAIATFQKIILLCILVYFVGVILQLALPEALRLILALAILGVILVSTVFVFLLATKVYGTGQGVLFAILTLIPLVGLIVLLIINGKATTVLKENGIKVGLLGASLSDIP
jgi:hypothetical protein